jgi:hypothetical protein
MRRLRAIAAAGIAAVAPLGVSHAAAPPSTVDDRIAVGFNGESLTGTNGGGGGSLGWLHNFNADTLAGVGVEYQSLANAHWTFGSLNGAYTFGPGDQRYSVYGEAHEGGGNSGARSIHYRTEVLGGVVTLEHRLSLQLEGKHIDIDTVRGYLPKAGVSYLWNPHLQTALSYSYSVGPNNLGTRLAAGRVDLFTPRVNFLGGFSFGEATAAVLSYVGTTKTNVPGLRLKEGYVGATVPLKSLRSEISLILDYQHLSSSQAESRRFQGNLNYIFHLGHHGT